MEPERIRESGCPQRLARLVQGVLGPKGKPICTSPDQIQVQVVFAQGKAAGALAGPVGSQQAERATLY
jgi:hypothetical protein